MPSESTGICPNCGKQQGPVDTPCPKEVCKDKGYRLIPVKWYQAAKEFAARQGRPLDPLLGRSLDRYFLIGKLGEGGMGAVYLALQRPLNREVALKVISGVEMTEDAMARFEREARAISMLDHPNIVKLHDYGVAELEFRIPYMALEYVKHGRNLRRTFAKMRAELGGAPIPVDVVLPIFSQILNALGTAHEAGIVHRDMKPENVMLAPVRGNPYFVKVLDFGLAKAFADVTGLDGTVTQAHQAVGSTFYMAPDPAPLEPGTIGVDGRADLYAVAVMLFELFTGVRPFDGATRVEVLVKKWEAGYDPLSLPAAQGLPEPLRAFLRQGMARMPEARFGCAEEMLGALEAALRAGVAGAVGLVSSHPPSSEARPKTPPSSTCNEGIEPTRLLRTGAKKGRLKWVALWLLGLGLAVGAAALVWLALGEGGGAVVEAPQIAERPKAPSSSQVEERPAQGQEAPGEPPRGPEVAAQASLQGERVVQNPPAMRVRFESEPPGAQVFMGGRALGKTPFDAMLEGSPGVQEFEFRIGGYRPRRVKAELGDNSVVRATLTRAARAGQGMPKRTKDEYPEP